MLKCVKLLKHVKSKFLSDRGLLSPLCGMMSMVHGMTL